MSLLIVLAISVLIQGGFFPPCIVLIGIILGFLSIHKKVKVNYKNILFFVLFSLLYLFCTIIKCVDIINIAKGLVPLICIMCFSLVVAMPEEQKQKLIENIVKIAIIFAISAITYYLIDIVKTQSVNRLVFTFEYANVCGIFFATTVLLSKSINNQKIKYLSIFLYVALLLTQSVGAIGLYILSECILCLKSKKIKNFIFLLSFVVVLGITVFLYPSRVLQSIGTFIERLLQIYDGMNSMIHNPLGIGAGNWNYVRHYWQSGYYDSTIIHSSIIQIGVNSGVLGLILFVAGIIQIFLRCKKGNIILILAVAMIFVHSMFDVTLSFLSINLLVSILLAVMTKTKENSNSSSIVPVIVIILISIFCGINIFNNRLLSNDFNNKNYQKVVRKFEDSTLCRYSYGNKLYYLQSKYILGEKEELLRFLDKEKYFTTDMCILNAMCHDSPVEKLIEYAESQKYNIKLYEEIDNYIDTATDIEKQRVEKLNRKAREEMSYMGKILYKYIGGK